MEVLYEIWELTFEVIKIILIIGAVMGILIHVGQANEDKTNAEVTVTIAEKFPLAIEYLQEREENQIVEPTIVKPEDVIPDKAVYQAFAEEYEYPEEHEVMPPRGVLTEEEHEELRQKLLAQLNGTSASTDKKHKRAI